MDIPRAPRRRRQPYVFAGIAVAVVAATLGAGRLRPASPEVERATVLIDRVRRAPMERSVRAPGSLVPEEIHWIPAVTAGRVEQILARAGTPVRENTVLLVLSNPDVQLEALESDRQLAVAEAGLASLEASLVTAQLAQETAVASARTEDAEAERADTVAATLAAEGLSSAMERARVHDRRAEAGVRLSAERRRLDVLAATTRTQLRLQRAQVDRLRAIARFHHAREASMQVVAGSAGVLQEMNLQLGEWVNPGALLAKVARPERLKAVLRVPDVQARDLAGGQRAVIDTHHGTVTGRVIRIDPAVQEGAVTVDVALDQPLPAGARADQSVDGVIEIEKLGAVLQVGRPMAGDPGETVTLYRLIDHGGAAVPVQVRLGRASADVVEVVQGLRDGDEVILSDLGRINGAPRVRLR